MDDIYKSVIEAIIFSSDEPIPEAEIIKAIKAIDGEETEITQEDVKNAVDQLNAFYTQNNSAINIVKIANGFLHEQDLSMLNMSVTFHLKRAKGG